jgi:uncharacterized protein YbjQ (UPF0145 family)
MSMLIVTTPDIVGRRIVETLGQAFGVVVRSRGLGGNIVAGLRSLVGGEIVEYTQMLEEARRHAVDRMTENAALMGADAVVVMRFDSSEIGDTMSEIVAYGTAVRLAPLEAPARAPAATTAVELGGDDQVGAAQPASVPFGQRTHAP